MEDRQKIDTACVEFIRSLSNLVTHPDVFELLDDAAIKAGYTISCKQFGIRGTRLSFIPRVAGWITTTGE